MLKRDAEDIRHALDSLVVDATSRNRSLWEILFGIKQTKLNDHTDWLYREALKALRRSKPSIFRGWEEPLSGKSIEEAISPKGARVEDQKIVY